MKKNQLTILTVNFSLIKDNEEDFYSPIVTEDALIYIHSMHIICTYVHIPHMHYIHTHMYYAVYKMYAYVM